MQAGKFKALLVAGLVLASAPLRAVEIDTCNTHAVLYAGMGTQALLRVKVVAKNGESLKSLRFRIEGIQNLSGVKVYRSGNAPFFSTNTDRDWQKATPVSAKIKATEDKVSASGNFTLAEGVNYFWLVGNVPSSAKGKVAAVCTGARDGKGQAVDVPEKDPGKGLRVYPYEYRIVPYYRPNWLLHLNPRHLTEEHFKLITDVILFDIYSDGNANLIFAPGPEKMAEARKRMKELRGKSPVNIIAGMKGGRELAPIMRNDNLRRRLAANLADYAITHKYNGVDIDWEYPASSDGGAAANWNNFAYFLSELRENLAGTGMSVSIAFTPNYDMPLQTVTDQLDFASTMSYDRPGQHATMENMKQDIARCRAHGIPAKKLVIGLPFYSNETRRNRNWDAAMGYGGILGLVPNIKAGDNTFKHPKSGEEHYFNGQTMIRNKAKSVISAGLGGLMIWAYETDAALDNPKSLAKALHSVARRTLRGSK